MPTLERLLDALGPPPAEVCIDWAWQLKSAVDGKLSADLDWSRIDLLESGELRIRCELTPRKFESQWAASQPLAATSAYDLIELLLKWSIATDVASDAPILASPMSAGQLAILLERRTRELAQCNFEAHAAKLPQTVLLKEAESSAPLKSRVKRAQTNRLPRIHLAWLATGLLCVLTISLAVYALTRNPSTAKIQTTALGVATHIEASAQSFNARMARESVDNNAQAALVPMLRTTDDLLDDGPQPPEVFGKEHDLRQDYGLPSLAPVGAVAAGRQNQVQRLSDSGGDLFGEGAETQAVAESAVVGNSIDASRSVELVGSKQVDVLQEMQRVTDLAEADEQASEIAERDDGTVAEPALLVGTSPMLQVQRLSITREHRIRKPEWRIRLSPAVEGCRVIPDGAQRISGRETARWCVVEEAAEEPRTQVVVVASLLQGRDSGIRWRIAAGAEDLPQIFVPLGKDYLDALYASLNQACQRLQNQIEQLRQLGKMSGLPAQLRAAASAQRKECESQEKLGRRMLQMVADAHRLQALLDSQLEVHAEVFDQSRLGSTALLQFGQLHPTVSENTAAENTGASEPASDSL